MLKNNKRKIIMILILFILSFFFIGYKLLLEKERIPEVVEEEKKIMIVAHPDDEMLWGGAHLIEEKYLVVCVTCGDDEEREKEFETVMKAVDCPYLSLGYPDRNTWENYEIAIKEELKSILNKEDYQVIVTHNPDGEYGHYQHQKVSNYITELAPKDKLYYFNHYYSQEEIDTLNLQRITEETVKEKERILTLYLSQKDIVNNHKAMIPYENFIPYDEWK